MKSLALGTFDKIHKGHFYYLKQANKYGDLYVVIASDETVKKVKKKIPKDNENIRLRNVSRIKFVKKAVLGNLGDKYVIIEEIKPDVICLGYDQIFFVDRLDEELRRRNINAKIVRIKPYKSDKYKSSLL